MRIFPVYRPDTITRTNIIRRLSHYPIGVEDLVAALTGQPPGKKRSKLVERTVELLMRMQGRGEAEADKDGKWTTGSSAAA